MNECNVASMELPDPLDAALADALVACLRAAAALRGPSLTHSIELRLQ